MKRCFLVIALILSACRPSTAPGTERDLVLATTTSTYDSGLLDAVLPVDVKVIAVGTGEALELGRRGSVDVVLVHAPEAERAFVAAGHGIDRRPVMWNRFVIAGPIDDPAEIRTLGAAAALQKIAQDGVTFISRGDDSGTHKKERALWKAGGGRPDWPNYLETGQGMAFTLRVADEKRAYTLTDNGTFLAVQRVSALQRHVENDPMLVNPYHVIRVNPAKHPTVNVKRSLELVDHLTSKATADKINAFSANGHQGLFHAGSP